MIKLNNKNITYVALADSSNSLKAPKEIWYADSNNSVKLVYRRKDALIEGEDYEKYHWLDGENGAYINTHTPITAFSDVLEFEFIVKSTNSQNGNVEMIGTLGDDFRIICFGGNYIYLAYCNIYDAGTQDYFIENTGTILKVILSSDGTHYYRNVNGVDLQPCDVGNMAAGDYGELLIFRIRPPQGYENHYYDGKFSYIKLGTKLHLIPCKLLKPVPKWLDANGIRRQVGECGMIDLVSGKFYGNVNSVGTFTVENYYERKEWLVGDGSAYIDTNIIVNVPTLRYSLEFIHDTTNNAEFLCGSRNSTSNDEYSSAIIIDKVYNNMIRLDAICTPSYPSLLYSNIILNAPNEVHINCRTNSAIVNDSSIAGNRTRFNNSPYTFRIFDVYPKDASTYPTTCTCKMSYFNLNDGTHSLNLIPCTLTMDLPASMDANNIPRTKGTSGMWDLVSDRFYGNVASSGTFKAVNLAEGVDYEVHQWLIGDGNAYINTLITKFDGIVDISFYFSSYNGSIFGRERGDSSIEDYSDRFVVTINSNVTPNGRIYGKDSNVEELPIANDERLIIDIDNGVATNKNGDTAIISVMANVTGRNLYLFADNYSDNPYNNKFNGRIGLFSISNKIYLIPIKLLKSIPSKYDANGIARQAGECGMYDTVNDVFYGNVASSGTFSVSDDN